MSSRGKDTDLAPPAKKPMRSVRGSFAWATAGNAVYAACQWGTISLLAKLGSPEIVGRYALAVAVTTPLLMLAQMNLRSVLVTDMRGEHDFRDYRDLRMATLALALFAIVAWEGFTRGQDETLTILLVGLAQAIDWYSDIFHGLMQQRDHMNRIAISLATRAALSLAALAVIMAFTGNLTLSLAGAVLVRIAVLLFYDSSLASRDLIGVRRPRASGARGFGSHLQILATASSLGIVLMICSLTTNVPRYFIADHLGTRSLGIFSAIASLTTGANLIVNALGQAATPRMAKLYSDGDHRGFARLSGKLAAVGVALGVAATAGAFAVGPLILRVFFRAEYARHSGVLFILAACAGASYVASLLGYSITACRRFREQIPLQVVCVMSTAAACWLLIPRFGLAGAALALNAGPVVQVVGELIILNSALRDAEPSAALAPEAAAL
jgi:O-antigen/teichoic acid export membrane protein